VEVIEFAHLLCNNQQIRCAHILSTTVSICYLLNTIEVW